jgi:hypothetical protein
MNSNLKNISIFCSNNSVDFNPILEYFDSSFLKLKRQKYLDSIQFFELVDGKNLIVEIGKNVIYCLNFTKGRMDVFCATGEPIIKEQLLAQIEKELIKLLYKKRLESIY